MARSRWKMALWTAFAGAGVAWGQQASVPSPASRADSGRILTVQEFGGPRLQCRVLKTWIQLDGSTAYEVKIIATGEKMTIAEANDVTAPPGTAQHGRMVRFFHWGNSDVPPANTPVPPGENRTVAFSSPVPPSSTTPRPTAQTQVIHASAPLPTVETQIVDSSASPCSPESVSAPMMHISPTPNVSMTGETTIVEQPEAVPASSGFGSRLHRLFHPHEDATVITESEVPAGATTTVTTVAPTTTTIVPTMTGPVTPTSAPMPHTLPAVPVTAAPGPQLSDVRQSWGKADHADVPLASPPSLPHADTTKPDPLTNLATFTKLPTVNKNADHDDSKLLAPKSDSSKGPMEVAALAGAPGTESIRAAGKGPFGPLGYVPVPIMTPPPLNHPIQPASAAPTPPPGQASTSPAATKPDFTPNAFTRWVKPPKDSAQPQDVPGGNAFTRPMAQTPSQQTPMQQPMQPMQMGYPTSMMTNPNSYPMAAMPPQPVSSVVYMAVPNGQTPAVASSADVQVALRNATVAGFTPQGPTTAPMAISAPTPDASAIHQASMIETSKPATASQDEVLVAILRDALYPSQREVAAERLAADKSSNPHVIEALVDRACNDEAVSVRTCCIRCLVTMHASTPEVRAAFKQLRQDRDPAVSQAAADGLASLNAF